MRRKSEAGTSGIVTNENSAKGAAALQNRHFKYF